ncbi:MAG TPA: sulfite exporter TauE/SafE family protein [Clostridiaceae bacterium]|nr:sulfite exporter TauE/SafE family protein [Clostridiaceae bacterium]
MKYVYFALVCFLSSLQQCFTGFGFAIISMPLLILLFPLRTISAVVALASLMLCSQVAFKMRKHIDFKIAAIPILSAFIGRTIGVNLLMTTNEKVLKPILGIVIILITIYIIFFKEKIKIKPNKVNGFISGISSGVLGGLFNTGGPPLVVYYLFALKDKLSYIGTIQFTFAIGNLYSVILHALHGNFNDSSVPLSLISLLAVTLGSFLGCRIISKVKNVNYAIYASMIMMGIFLIFEGVIR